MIFPKMVMARHCQVVEWQFQVVERQVQVAERRSSPVPAEFNHWCWAPQIFTNTTY